MSDTTARQPTLFIPHGGGPCFFMDPPPAPRRSLGPDGRVSARHRQRSLRAAPARLLVISGHWEATAPDGEHGRPSGAAV